MCSISDFTEMCQDIGGELLDSGYSEMKYDRQFGSIL